jgi:hypothetical protein
MVTEFVCRSYCGFVKNPLDYLKYHKNVEVHDVNKTYEKYVDGEYLRVPTLYTFDTKEGLKQEYVAFGICLTEEQSKRLGNYCECAVDKMCFLNPTKYVACRACAGCVKSMDMASEEFIAKAIEKRRKRLRSKL